MAKNILILWHLPSYGIGFFKNILSSFYLGRITLNQKEKVEGISQIELENGFLIDNGFVFDKVYYLYFSDETSSTISDRNKKDYLAGRARVELLNDDLIKETKTEVVWEEVLKNNFNSIKEELDFVSDNYLKKFDSFKSQYWRNIHYYPIQQQIEWFKEYSNASKIYGANRIDFIDFTKKYGVTDLRNEEMLDAALMKFLKEKKLVQSNNNLFNNTGLGTLEMQLAFRNLRTNTDFSKINISIFSIVDQKENTNINYRFRDLKYTLKNEAQYQLKSNLEPNILREMDYCDFKIYPSGNRRIKFRDISFITTCDSDSSHNDKYLQKSDGKFYRIVNYKFTDLEKLLPKELFCKINKSTIISNCNENIQGWSTNCEEVTLAVSYVKNNGQFWANKNSEDEYMKELIDKPVSFTIGKSFIDDFKSWFNI